MGAPSFTVRYYSTNTYLWCEIKHKSSRARPQSLRRTSKVSDDRYRCGVEVFRVLFSYRRQVLLRYSFRTHDCAKQAQREGNLAADRVDHGGPPAVQQNTLACLLPSPASYPNPLPSLHLFPSPFFFFPGIWCLLLIVDKTCTRRQCATGSRRPCQASGAAAAERRRWHALWNGQHDGAGLCFRYGIIYCTQVSSAGRSLTCTFGRCSAHCFTHKSVAIAVWTTWPHRATLEILGHRRPLGPIGQR